MKFAKASITRQGPPRLLDASASSQKGRGSEFRFCSRTLTSFIRRFAGAIPLCSGSPRCHKIVFVNQMQL